jgi:hypothetical protein
MPLLLRVAYRKREGGAIQLSDLVTAKSTPKQPVTLADMPNDNFRTALQFWLDVKGTRILPDARSISPSLLPRELLPFLILVSVAPPGPKRLKFRLVGTGIVSAIGYDFTGKFGEDVDGAGPTNERFFATMKSKQPYLYGGPLIWSPRDYKTYRSLVMPFGNEKDEVVRFLSYVEFES